MKKFLLSFILLIGALMTYAATTVQKINGIYYTLDTTAKTAEVRNSTNSNEYYFGKIDIPENVTYQTDDFKVISIRDSAFSWCSSLTSVTIPNSVTSIGTRAFYGCSSLKSVTIPNSVTSIGDSAFSGCSSLTSVTIPNSVTSIGYEAFRACSTLTSVTIPNSVTSIGDYAFSGCSSLTSVTIPNSVTSIGAYAFRECSSLTSVEIPNSVTSIGTYVFSECSSLTSVTIGNSVTSIEESVFEGCKNLTSVTIGNSVTSIGINAFHGCSSLKSIEFPNSVSSIWASAFNGCSSLKSIEFPNSVSSIGANAFYGCLNLTSVTIPNSVTSIGKTAFKKCPIEFLYIDCTNIDESLFAEFDSLENLIIGNSVTSIGASAFEGCFFLTSVTIGNSVKSIEKGAFRSCPRLTKVNISDLASWCQIRFGLEESNPLQNAHHLYLNDEEVVDLKIPNTVNVISPYAFNFCEAIRSVTIPNSVTTIDYHAFYGCSSLTSVTIGNSVTSIGTMAFYGCPIDFLEIDCRKIREWFKNDTSIKNLTIGDSVTSISNWAFSGCSALTSVTIGNSLTEIGGDVFNGCSALKNLSLGNSITSIGNYAFFYCSSLTSVKIPNSVTSIGTKAFYGCSSLTSVTIGNSVTSIENEAFRECQSLKSITIASSDISIRVDAFWGCPFSQISLLSQTPPNCYYSFYDFTGTSTLIIPDNSFMTYLDSEWRGFLKMEDQSGRKYYVGTDDVYSYRFIESSKEAMLVGCNIASTNVSIPERVICNLYGDETFYPVKYIGVSAFSGCDKLSQIKLPANLIRVGTKAFSGCTALNRVDISDIEAWCKIDFQSKESNPLWYANNLYLNNELITSLHFPSNLSKVKDYTFIGCNTLTNVIIPNSVTSIGNSAFQKCSGLTSMSIPNSVTLIGNSAFQECSGLASVSIPNSVSSIGNSAFQECSGLNSVSIPNSVSSIGDAAFRGCSGLTDLFLPNSILTIGEQAFGNLNLNTLTFEDGPEKLTLTNNLIKVKTLYLGRDFTSNLSTSNLETLNISSFVKSIPGKAFNNSTLSSVTINPGAEISIEADAFTDCYNLTSILLPEDISEIGERAFKGTGLKNITVPSGVIADNAFANCYLDDVILGSKVESIGEKAFEDNNAIKNVYSTSTTPPLAQNNSFSYYGAQLWVPEEAIETYYNNPRCWYRFYGKPLICPEGIEMTGPTSIKGIPGETVQLSASISPSNVSLDRVLWTSTNSDIASVDNNGLVTIHMFDSPSTERRGLGDGNCQIIASTLYEDGPVAVVNIDSLLTSIEYINFMDVNGGSGDINSTRDIYSLQGVCMKREATQEDIDALAPGIYIIGGKKVVK